MSDISIDGPIRVKGCPYCELLNDDSNIVYKPRKNLDECSFVIVKCPLTGKDVVVASEHVETLPRGIYNLAIYHAKKYKNTNVGIKVDRKRVSDHWHAYIELI